MILSHRDFILHLPESFSPSKSSPNLTSVEALKWKMNLLSTLIVPTVSSTLASSPPQTFLKCRCPQGQTQDSGPIIGGSTRMGKTGSRQGMGRQSKGHGSHQQLQCASRKLQTLLLASVIPQTTQRLPFKVLALKLQLWPASCIELWA